VKDHGRYSIKWFLLEPTDFKVKRYIICHCLSKCAKGEINKEEEYNRMKKDIS